jgi:predicted dinucleotide-binding enzyme
MPGSGLADELGSLATAGTGEQAAEAGDILVVAIPLKAYEGVPVKPLAGKVVIDANNYYPQRDGHIADLDDGTLTSSGFPRDRALTRRRARPG